MPDLPVVLIFAPQAVYLESPPSTNLAETRELDCRHYTSDENLNAILVRECPDVIVSFGKRDNYPRLQSAPFAVQKRRLHFEFSDLSQTDIERVGTMVFGLFLHRTLSPKNELFVGGSPLVSVYTPTFRSGSRINRAYQSLLNQTYTNWEWIVVDDSDDEGETLRLLSDIAKGEPRLRIFPLQRRSGKIGQLKRWACGLSRGEILVELDHDDELTPDALSLIVQTFLVNPEAGFVYSDWAEVSEETGESLRYEKGWAFGYGKYRTESYGGRKLLVAIAPPLNAQTIAHIVGVPNHVRAWMRDIYWQIGGHNPDLHVADDYELLVRTFLQTKIIHIPKLCYIQYLNSDSNTQNVRRREIQRLVRCIGEYYEPQIKARLEQLKLPDIIQEKVP